MNVWELSDKDWQYIRDTITHADVKQAFAQLEVLKGEAEFETMLEQNITKPQVIRKIAHALQQMGFEFR